MIQKTYFKTKNYCKVKFIFNTDGADTIEILGLNADWDTAIPMARKKDGSFSCELSLPKSTTHEFKYRVNAGQWLNDPFADSETPNIYGGSNSVISV
jgi:hypothetical protein